uniref:Uncharacterized protein n=1 Tax=Glossina pallidipes TaxID=7398 RepID=A0A1B0AIJ1_GLOPL
MEASSNSSLENSLMNVEKKICDLALEQYNRGLQAINELRAELLQLLSVRNRANFLSQYLHLFSAPKIEPPVFVGTIEGRLRHVGGLMSGSCERGNILAAVALSIVFAALGNIFLRVVPTLFTNWVTSPLFVGIILRRAKHKSIQRLASEPRVTSTVFNNCSFDGVEDSANHEFFNRKFSAKGLKGVTGAMSTSLTVFIESQFSPLNRRTIVATAASAPTCSANFRRAETVNVCAVNKRINDLLTAHPLGLQTRNSQYFPHNY